MHSETQETKEVIRIGNITDEINRLHTETLRHSHEAIGSGAAAIASAIQCGKVLTKLKRVVGHGKFLDAIIQQCPELHERTARRYMNLANTTHVSDLDKCETLRQAYQTCGIIPAPEPHKRLFPGPVDPLVVFFANLLKPVSRVKLLTEEVSVDELTQEQKAILKGVIKPIIELERCL